MLLTCVSFIVNATQSSPTNGAAKGNGEAVKPVKTLLAHTKQSKLYGNAQRKKAQIAIIIDDIGNKQADAAAFALSEKVTFSILPHTRFSTQFSTYSYHQGREVMLHMPMESLHGEALGDGGLFATMYPQEVENTLLMALESVPHAIGVNNHMGSKLTQMTLQMNAVMDVLSNNNLYFIDSRTTKFTKAHLIAKERGVVSAQRHVFLDHHRNEAFLEQQFAQLLKKARRDGSVIGIAHPYKISIEFLKRKLASLPDDVELITVSDYLGVVQADPRIYSEQPRLASKEAPVTSDIAPQ